jgi:hypothetical protein
VKIRRRTVGEILMSTGIGCGMAYILVNLSALPPSLTRFSGVLLYVSIVALSSGLLFYLLARAGGSPLTQGALSGREKRDV